MEPDYNKINNIDDYEKLLETGMFFEFYPDLTGDYDTDMKLIDDLERKIEGE